MEITLFQFPRFGQLANMSPFCMKLETYLRLVGLPYGVKFTRDLGRAPKGKLPFVKIDGQEVADSSFIIDHLGALNPEWNLDRHLDSLQRAQSVAVQRLIEDSLVPTMVHSRWVDEEGWAQFSRLLFHGAPAPVRVLVGGMLHRSFRKRMHLHGVGRHSRDEIMSIVDRDLGALSTLLGDRSFFHGDRPTSVDCSIYAVTAQAAMGRVPEFWSRNIDKYPNLIAHAKRMLEEFQRNESLCRVL